MPFSAAEGIYCVVITPLSRQDQDYFTVAYTSLLCYALELAIEKGGLNLVLGLSILLQTDLPIKPCMH
jgi:hypothetical protein